MDTLEDGYSTQIEPKGVIRVLRRAEEPMKEET